MAQYLIETGDGADDIHLRLSPRDALFLAQRILNQLDFKQPEPVAIILNATVRGVPE